MSSPNDQIMEFMFPVAVTAASSRLEVLVPGLGAGALPQGHSVSEVTVPEAGEAVTVNWQGEPVRGSRGLLHGGQGGYARRSGRTRPSLGALMSSGDNERRAAAATPA